MLVRKLEEEIGQYYAVSAKEAILDYILLDPFERNRLQIRTYPIKYPTIVITSPVPWHCNKTISHQMLEKNLYIGNPIFDRLQNLWFEG